MKPDPNIEAEEDFWDLGDEGDVPLIPKSRSEDSSSEEESDESDSEEVIPEEEGELSSEEEAPEELSEENELLEKDEPLEEEPAEEPDEDSPEELEESLPAAGGLKNYISGVFRETSIVEKASLLCVFLLFMGAASWGISTYYDQAPEGDLVVFDENFPIEGTHAAIDEIETYWRKPIRAGDDADHGVQLKAMLIPCARIVLSGSGTAALGVSFRDSDQKLIGDPISLEVENGTFSKTGTSEIVITSTAGFESSSEINAYTNLDIDPWSLLIVEGAPGTNPSYTEDDKKLAEVRISADSR
ncbi:hypothetical protein OAF06_04330 [Akkermansiaceae bacterium]|nr:hypothetical protein [Akkermansiaceae bacterium]MDC0265101.1 hypothetical protein [bacterium]MDB4283969.1 hypothetical protein [Akkermansiaceae bacterium]MDB4332707.1 hypothetical protein [Akkermansiaceae bacterium]MDB4615169.1 hypothetical protein [Akkermansiaceae bacterium]